MKAVIVGAGIGGLSTALYLAKKGINVIVLEKNSLPGGRARWFSEGDYEFDMGPSWYLMPEVFEKFYREVGEEPPTIREVSPLFSLISERDRKSESFYKYDERLASYIADTEFMYNLAMEKFLYKELKISDMLDSTIINNMNRFPIFNTLDHFNRRYFPNDEFLQKALGFSAVFLGGSPFNTPAIYAMVNYAIYGKGVFYPEEGFKGLVLKLFEACKRAGVEFKFDFEVDRVQGSNGVLKHVENKGRAVDGDYFVFNMDYHYADKLLSSNDEVYWMRRKLAPSAILVYAGVEGEVKSPHHVIIINGDWRYHFNSIMRVAEPDLNNISYYVSYTRATDKRIKGDSLVFLIPISAGLFGINPEAYVKKTINDFKEKTGSKFDVKFMRVYTPFDFLVDYNAYRGTAFGISHTLDQTGPFRPPMRNRRWINVYHVGQYTQPGIGVPMVTISAMIVGKKILEDMEKRK
ncbi:phytoene desaturase [Sulfolobus acidocaldarius SUSAZ]|nr:phytoene desaturase [Sulfolobus acidocaldarius SUSAZ]